MKAFIELRYKHALTLRDMDKAMAKAGAALDKPTASQELVQ